VAEAPAPRQVSFGAACADAQSRQPRTAALQRACRGPPATPVVDSQAARRAAPTQPPRPGPLRRCQAWASHPDAPPRRHRAQASDKHRAGTAARPGSPDASSPPLTGHSSAVTSKRQQQQIPVHIPRYTCCAPPSRDASVPVGKHRAGQPKPPVTVSRLLRRCRGLATGTHAATCHPAARSTCQRRDGLLELVEFLAFVLDVDGHVRAHALERVQRLLQYSLFPATRRPRRRLARSAPRQDHRSAPASPA